MCVCVCVQDYSVGSLNPLGIPYTKPSFGVNVASSCSPRRNGLRVAVCQDGDHLVMTNVAMENANHKWRFSLLGKSICFY